MVDHGAMKAYSEDLRKKVVEAVEKRGTSKSEAARLFSISLSSVKRYTKLADRGEPLTPRKGGGRPHSGRRYEEATRGGRTREALGHRLRAAPLSRKLRRQDPQRAHPEEAPEAHGLLSKKGLWGRWNGTSGEEPLGR
jgi:transposase-like protein